MKAFRTLLVISPALYVILLMAPDVAHCFYPKGTFGYIASRYSGAVVTNVEPHSAAADAGIQPGDRIDTRVQNLHERLFLGTGITIITEMTHRAVGSVPHPGERAMLRVFHDGHWRTVTLVARAHAPTSSDIFWNIWGLAERAIRLVLGAALVLARPGRVTWAFYAYMLGVGTFGTSDYYNSLPAPLWIMLVVPEYVVGGAVPASYALFWLLFPAGVIKGWRRAALSVVVVGFCVGIGIQLAELFSSLFSFDTSTLEQVWFVYNLLWGTLGVSFLAATYLASRGFDRRLFGWLLVVDGGIFAAELALITFQLVHPPPPRIFGYIFLLGLLLPLVIAYGIVRYQMFDVEYVLSRTIVYSVVVVIAAGLFIGVDIAFASYFYASKAEVAIDIALALGVGFALRSFYGRAIDDVDRLLFLRRYDSRMRLKRTFDAITHADSQSDLEVILTSQAAAALGLASAEFFKKFADGGYLREIGFGWASESLWNLLPDDKLVRMLGMRSKSIDLRSIGWSRTDESAPHAPMLAIPMYSGDAVIGVTLYGDRVDGISLSPDDVKGLVELSQRCAGPYAFFGSVRSVPAIREVASARAAL